jgi:hypothetical protein
MNKLAERLMELAITGPVDNLPMASKWNYLPAMRGAALSPFTSVTIKIG